MGQSERIALFRILDHSVSQIAESENPRLSAYQVGVALDLGFVREFPLEEIAKRCGVTRQCISKGARAFSDALSLPRTRTNDNDPSKRRQQSSD